MRLPLISLYCSCPYGLAPGMASSSMWLAVCEFRCGVARDPKDPCRELWICDSARQRHSTDADRHQRDRVVDARVLTVADGCKRGPQFALVAGAEVVRCVCGVGTEGC